jgi:hypothetical protein
MGHSPLVCAVGIGIFSDGKVLPGVTGHFGVENSDKKDEKTHNA